jgi:7,8-dihydro-6-hydroxymethylpterin-pyrophosphokinase
VLIPLLEICEDYIHPIYQKSIDDLYDECRDEGEVMIYNSI